MIKLIFTGFVLIEIMFLFGGCKDNNSDNKPPATPSLSMPTTNSTNIANNTSLNWLASAGAKGYNIQVSTSSDFTTTLTNVTNIIAISYSPNGLLPSTKYYWRVNASNNFGNSLWSEIWNFTTSIDVPTLISPLNNSGDVLNNVSLSWNVMADATSYNLQVSTVSDFSSKLIDQGNVILSNFNLTALESATKYYWRVSLNNSLGTSQWSDVWNFTTNLIPTNNLVAYYPFNGNANDNSGNGHNGTVNGSTLTSDRKGNANSAYSFNGVDNYISIQDTEALNLIGNFTISAWFNSNGCATPCDPPAYHTIIMKRDVSVTPTDDWPWGLSISYIDGGSGNEFKKIYATRRSNGVADYKWSTNQIQLNTWQHVVIAIENNVQSIYINGTFDSSSQFIQTQLLSTKNINIGWSLRTGEEQFKGQIDDIRIYNRSLSSQEVQILYLE